MVALDTFISFVLFFDQLKMKVSHFARRSDNQSLSRPTLYLIICGTETHCTLHSLNKTLNEFTLMWQLKTLWTSILWSMRVYETKRKLIQSSAIPVQFDNKHITYPTCTYSLYSLYIATFTWEVVAKNDSAIAAMPVYLLCTRIWKELARCGCFCLYHWAMWYFTKITASAFGNLLAEKVKHKRKLFFSSKLQQQSILCQMLASRNALFTRCHTDVIKLIFTDATKSELIFCGRTKSLHPMCTSFVFFQSCCLIVDSNKQTRDRVAR